MVAVPLPKSVPPDAAQLRNFGISVKFQLRAVLGGYRCHRWEYPAVSVFEILKISQGFEKTLKMLSFRIMAVEKLGASFNHVSYPLKFTPRRMIVHPTATTMVVIETDHAAYTSETLDRKRNDMADVSCWLILCRIRTWYRSALINTFVECGTYSAFNGYCVNDGQVTFQVSAWLRSDQKSFLPY